MKKLIALLLVAFSANAVYAADDCAARAAEKKLAGAAKNSFMKKCQADAGTPARKCRVRRQGQRTRSWPAPPEQLYEEVLG